MRGERRACGAVRRGDDLVAAGGEGDPQRAQDLRVVVGDQDLHGGASVVDVGGATGSEMTMVRPPPGVSSGVRVPPMPSMKPFERARPRPRPVVLSVSPRRWNGTKISSPRSGGIAGPAVDDADLDGAAEAARRDADAAIGGAKRTALASEVDEHALQQHGVGKNGAAGPGRGRARLSGPSTELVEGAQHHVGDVDRPQRDGEDARFDPAHVQQVRDEGGERVEALLGGGEQLVAVRGAASRPGGAQPADRGGRGGERAPQVVADGGEQGAAHPVGLGETRPRAAVWAEVAVLERRVELSGDHGEQAAFRACEVAAVQLEDARAAVGGPTTTRVARSSRHRLSVGRQARSRRA